MPARSAGTTAAGVAGPGPKRTSSSCRRRAGFTETGGQLVVGGRQHIKWWRGGMRPSEVAESIKDGPDITRFAPGRTGPGLTDDLDQLATLIAARPPAAAMPEGGLLACFPLRENLTDRTLPTANPPPARCKASRRSAPVA